MINHITAIFTGGIHRGVVTCLYFCNWEVKLNFLGRFVLFRFWRKEWSLTRNTASSGWMCCRLWCWQKTLWVDRAPRRDAWWCLWLCVSALSWYVGSSVLFPFFYFIWFLAWRWNLSLSPRKLSKMRSCFHCSLCWRSWIWLASWVRGRRFFSYHFLSIWAKYPVSTRHNPSAKSWQSDEPRRR